MHKRERDKREIKERESDKREREGEIRERPSFTIKKTILQSKYNFCL